MGRAYCVFAPFRNASLPLHPPIPLEARPGWCGTVEGWPSLDREEGG